MHGKTSRIRHEGKGVFAGLPDAYEATRYHSLVVDATTLPDCLEITAWTENEDGSFDEIMGLRHREHPVEGVQFHPESILTEHGHALLKNFLRRADAPCRDATADGTDMPITPQEALQRTIEHREIFLDEMVDLMRQVMRGEVSPTMTAAILTGLRVKKETVGEIAAAAHGDARVRAAGRGGRPHAPGRHRRHRRRWRAHLQHLHRVDVRGRRGRREGRQARQPQRVVEVRQRRRAGSAGRQHRTAAGAGRAVHRATAASASCSRRCTIRR